MSDQEWLQWRRGGLGGSDIGALLGLSTFTSPWSLWADKRGLLPPDETTQRQRIGHRMEAVLAAEFNEDTGLYVVGEQTWCEQPGHEHRRCTVDGFVGEHDENETGDPSLLLGTIQFKTDARYRWPDDEPPPAIRAQCVWEMGVTGMEHCWLVVMFGGFRIDTFEIDWDRAAREDWEFMCERADAFWNDHVLADIPPPIDGSDATADALRAVYPGHVEGVEVDLTALADLIAERGELKRIDKTATDRLKVIDNTIKAALGDGEVGVVDGEPIFTYRTSERAGYVVEPATVRTLRNAPKPKTRRTAA